MVLIKLACRPEDEQATVGVRISAVPHDVSLAALKSQDDEIVLNIQISLRCISSTQPSRSLTINAEGSIFNNTRPESGYLDNLSLGMLSGLVCTVPQDGRTPKTISLGNYRVHRARQDGDDAQNLLDRPGALFITVPSKNSGESVQVLHTLSAKRLFVFADGISPDNVHVDEQYKITLLEGYVGTGWWCWGGLEDELQGKKLHAFAEGLPLIGDQKKPSSEEIEREGWAVGDDVSQLKFAIEEGSGKCEIRIVE